MTGLTDRWPFIVAFLAGVACVLLYHFGCHPTVTVRPVCIMQLVPNEGTEKLSHLFENGKGDVIPASMVLTFPVPQGAVQMVVYRNEKLFDIVPVADLCSKYGVPAK